MIVKHIKHFRIYNSFYADLLEDFNIVENKNIDTLGVWVTDKVNLDVNYDFFNSLSFVEQLAILEHEINHITNYHIYRSKNKDKGLFNIAADISINQYISNLPKGALCPEKGMKENASTEYYYEIIKNKSDKVKSFLKKLFNQDGQPSKKYQDMHKTWSKSDMNKVLDTITNQISKSMQKGNLTDKQIKDLKDSINNTQSNSKNSCGEKSNIDEIIEKINAAEKIASRKVNWRQELRKFIMKNVEKKKRNTIKYPNTRYNIPYGRYKMRSEHPKGIIVVDISPSISMPILNLFKQEVKKLKYLMSEIKVFLVDDEIRDELVIKNNNDKFFENKSINTGSGTDLCEIFKHIQKKKINNYNFLIYFTDLEGQVPDKSLNPPYSVLWAVYNPNPDYNLKVNFGKVLNLNEQPTK